MTVEIFKPGLIVVLWCWDSRVTGSNRGSDEGSFTTTAVTFNVNRLINGRGRHPLSRGYTFRRRRKKLILCPYSVKSCCYTLIFAILRNFSCLRFEKIISIFPDMTPEDPVVTDDWWQIMPITELRNPPPGNRFLAGWGITWWGFEWRRVRRVPYWREWPDRLSSKGSVGFAGQPLEA